MPPAKPPNAPPQTLSPIQIPAQKLIPKLPVRIMFLQHRLELLQPHILRVNMHRRNGKQLCPMRPRTKRLQLPSGFV